MHGQSLTADLLPTPRAMEVPQLVGGRYRVVARGGPGAEGSVYRGVDLYRGEEVALKCGPAGPLAAEYRRSATLQHPHLARALTLWRGGGTCSLAFEYGEEDLTALRGLSESVVVRYLAEVARALGHLHRRGIVHRDVKPQKAGPSRPPPAPPALLGGGG